MGCCMVVLKWLFSTRLNICYFYNFCVHALFKYYYATSFRSFCLVIWHSEYSGKNRILYTSTLLQHPAFSNQFSILETQPYTYQPPFQIGSQPYIYHLPTTMNVIPYTGLSDLTTYLSDNSKAVRSRTRRTTPPPPQYTLIQNVPPSDWTHQNPLPPIRPQPPRRPPLQHPHPHSNRQIHRRRPRPFLHSMVVLRVLRHGP